MQLAFYKLGYEFSAYIYKITKGVCVYDGTLLVPLVVRGLVSICEEASTFLLQYSGAVKALNKARDSCRVEVAEVEIKRDVVHAVLSRLADDVHDSS